MAVVINGSGTVTGLSVGGLPDGTVDADTLATDSVTAVKIPDTVEADLKSGRKNLIINGTGKIDQRGSTTSINAYGMDRWRTYGGPGDITLSQSSGVGEGDGFAIKVRRTTSTSQVSTIGLVHGLETLDSKALAGKEVTISFRARVGSDWSPSGCTANILGGEGVDQNPIGMTNTNSVISQSFTPTSEFVTYSWSGTVPADKTQLSFTMYWTPVGTAGTNDWIEIREVQLELGSQATDFEHRSYGEELALCQRYYEVLGSTAVTDYGFMYIGANWTSTQSRFGLHWNVTKRTSPTITESGTWYVRNAAGSSIAVTSKSFDQPSPYGAAPYVTCSGGLTAGQASQIWGDDGLIKVDAEL